MRRFRVKVDGNDFWCVDEVTGKARGARFNVPVIEISPELIQDAWWKLCTVIHGRD